MDVAVWACGGASGTSELVEVYFMEIVGREGLPAVVRLRDG